LKNTKWITQNFFFKCIKLWYILTLGCEEPKEINQDDGVEEHMLRKAISTKLLIQLLLLAVRKWCVASTRVPPTRQWYWNCPSPHIRLSNLTGIRWWIEEVLILYSGIQSIISLSFESHRENWDYLRFIKVVNTLQIASHCTRNHSFNWLLQLSESEDRIDIAWS